jgi:probable HAF family extracellular repeat protein
MISSHALTADADRYGALLPTRTSACPSWRSALFLFVVLIAWLPSRVLSQVYEMQELPFQYPMAINDSGAVLGFDGSSTYLWEKDGSTGIAGLYPGGSSSGYGLNNLRQVVGLAAAAGGQGGHAFLWENFVTTDLNIAAQLYSQATCINDSGWVAGIVFDSSRAHPFFWKNGVAIDIATPGDQGSGADAMNIHGQVVGSSRLNDSTVHAYLWQDGGVSDLGTFGAGTYSWARGVNNLGQAVGNGSLNGGSGLTALLWDGGVTDLGHLGAADGAQGWSDAYDINDEGVIVGRTTWDSHEVQANTHGFVRRNGVMTDLNALTDTTGGWEIIGAIGITNRGDIAAQAVLKPYYNYVRAVLLKKGDIFLKSPTAGEKWVSGDVDTIRWRSGLPPGEKVTLRYSLDGGGSWSLIATNVTADDGKYAWTIPDTLSTRARVLISSAADASKNDTSETFKIKGYVLTRMSPQGNYIPYDFATDRWGFGNSREAVWPSTWYSRFDYSGIDPFTGKSYLSGSVATAQTFRAAKSADHPDWPSFVNTFGLGVAYDRFSSGIYSPTAVARWASIKGKWNGSCFGFAISDAIAFRNATGLKNIYTALPDFAIPHMVGSDTNTIAVMNEIFTHQFGNPHQEYIGSRWTTVTPTQAVNELKEMLVSDDAPVRSLNIYNNGPKGGGHAIVAYKLHQNTVLRNLYYLSVYDNSYPDDANALITIDTAQNGGQGKWDYPNWVGWGGTKKLLLIDEANSYLSYPQLPGNAATGHASPFVVPANELEISPARGADAVIRDVVGNVTGYADSVLQVDIPGSWPHVILDGNTTPPTGYTLPDSAYSIALSNFTEDHAQTFLFVGDQTFSVARDGATADQKDRIFYDGAVSVVNPDTAQKTVTLVSILNQMTHQGQEKMFSLGAVTLSTNDSLRMENAANDGLKFSSFSGSSKTYTLDVELDNYFNGAHRFRHEGVSLGGNSAHLIQPNWGALSGGAVKILIDDGNDGTVDDSMLVSDQPTGVGNQGLAERPTAFRLHQNYPNPFNPRTTISYDVPRAAHVRLKVYDVFGREVATLVDDVQEPGVQSVVWDATNMASGVYFYRLLVGGFVETKKMVLMR